MFFPAEIPVRNPRVVSWPDGNAICENPATWLVPQAEMILPAVLLFGMVSESPVTTTPAAPVLGCVAVMEIVLRFIDVLWF